LSASAEVTASASGTSQSDSSFCLDQQWEIVTIEEVERRMSEMNIFDEPEMFTLPDNSASPTDLNDDMLDSLLRELPPRAQGYPWILVSYND